MAYKNPEDYKKWAKEYYKTHKRHLERLPGYKKRALKSKEHFRKQSAINARRHTWLKRYGITEKDYQVLCESQNNLCAICGSPPKPARQGCEPLLHVDHCHETNKVRGLLCQKCNMAIGLLSDNPFFLLKAVKYLQK